MIAITRTCTCIILTSSFLKVNLKFSFFKKHMEKIFFSFVFLLSHLFGVGAKPCGDGFNEVSTFIGSGGPAYGYGGVNPGAQYPFSPMRLGPDTNNDHLSDISFRHFSGYNYLDTTIRAFSHTHTVGAGVNDLGNFGIMPFHLRSNKMELGGNNSKFWWSQFDKSTETSTPGRYQVFLSDPGVQVDLLAIGTHAGMHRYTWVKTDKVSVPGLVIDICHAAKLSENDKVQDSSCLEATISIDKDTQTFTGSVLFSGSLSRHIWVYIYGEIVPISDKIEVGSWRTCSGFHPMEICQDDVASVTATDGVLFTSASLRPKVNGDDFFGQSPTISLQVDVRVGISFISVELAKTNLREAMQDSSDFLILAQKTKTVWCNALNFASITPLPGDKDISQIFYSAAYRAQLSPTRYTEVG